MKKKRHTPFMDRLSPVQKRKFRLGMSRIRRGFDERMRGIESDAWVKGVMG